MLGAGLLPTPPEVMPRKSQKPMVHKVHLKYTGLQQTTIKRYRRNILRFFTWLELSELLMPKTFDLLDVYASEYVNHLYMDDYPLGWASDFVCGIKRFYPQCRLRIPVTVQYFKAWVKSTKRTRAIPLSPEIVMAMASTAFLQRLPRLAALLLVGFLGLLRTGEMVTLCKRQFLILGGGSLAVIMLEETKTSRRSNFSEHVTIQDPAVVRFLVKVLKPLNPDDKLFSCNHLSLGRHLTALGKFLCLKSPQLTPYGIRRGGATFHFLSHGSYDLTRDLGRWNDQKTAKQYINQPTSDIALHSLGETGTLRVQRGVLILPGLLESFSNN